MVVAAILAVVMVRSASSPPDLTVTITAPQSLRVTIADTSALPVCLAPGKFNSYRRITAIYRRWAVALTDPFVGRPIMGCVVLHPGETRTYDFPLTGRLPDRPSPPLRICYDLFWHFGSKLEAPDEKLRSCATGLTLEKRATP
jgi:hypothetical protein